MLRRSLSALAWLLVCAAALFPGARAQPPDGFSDPGPLRPEQILVLANLNFGPSIDLAREYMQARGIPPENLFIVGMGDEESISRRDYEQAVAGPLREFFIENDLRAVRCLLLMHGAPLRILEAPATAEMKRMDLLRADAFALAVERLGAIRDELNTLVAAAPAASPPEMPPAEMGEPADQLACAEHELEAALRAAADRITSPAGTPDPRAAARWAELWVEAFGQSPPAQLGLDAPAPPPAGPPVDRRRIELLLLKPLDPDALTELLDLVAARNGLVGRAHLALQLAGRFRPDWRHRAALDSELATLFWPEFSPAGPLPNPHYFRRRADGPQPPTLLTCRLDAPDAETVRRMIADCLRIERAGLRGNVYIDARGKPLSESGYGDYDENLRRLARFLDRETSLTVILDDDETLFQPGAAPAAALYCGWYSLANYVDAFEFVPGAVGYHIASSEAMTLRRDNARNWCPALLRDGVAATLGPVEEPYLTAFPRPTEFFAHLLAGRRSLAEVYALTLPSVSWMMTLIGDPLYRPFAAHPVLDEDQFARLLRE